MVTFYQVGGSVRDKFLGLKSKDIDYAVEADSFEAMKAAVVERGGEIFLEKPEYLTIRAKVPELGACDFVLCRKDGAYYDGRRPETVTPGTIYDDLERRDFTINAMALREADDVLIDPHGGRDDLSNRWLRCVGNPEDRFTEDGLRMLRAIRFSITKSFDLEENIHRLLRQASFVIPRLAGVSVERVRDELHKCFFHDTYATLDMLHTYSPIEDYIFIRLDKQLWLRPTLEAR